MSGALLRKELHEHGAVVAVTFGLGAIILLALLAQAAANLGGRFVGLVRFSLLFGPLIAVVLANRLLFREFSGRTQLFLETLPIGRVRVFATKWLLGCALTLLAAVLAWLAALNVIRRTEVLAWDDATGPLFSIATYWLVFWCVAAMAAMLGRYRYAVWGAFIVVIFIATTSGGIPFFELPVLRLLGADVQMARGMPAPSAFHYAIAIALVAAVAAGLLALWGSGGIASVLAQRMTARERVFLLVSLIAVVTTIAVLEPQPDPPPFRITDGERVDGRFTTVGVTPSGNLDAAVARDLARTLADDVDTLIEALSLDMRVPVFILPQQGLDRYVLRLAAMRNADGIALRIAPNAPRDFVRAIVAHSLLVDATRGRAIREDRHVLLDGLAGFWALRDDPDARERWRIRAAAIDAPLLPEDLTEWARTSERLGECVSLSLAFSVVDVLVERLGLDEALALMRHVLRPRHDDARVVLERRPAARLADRGLDWSTLAQAAEASRQAARGRHAAELAARPSIAARVEWRNSPERGIEIETTVDGVEPYSVYYRQLAPWDTDGGDMPRLDVRSGSAILPISPPRGARVLVVIETDDPILDCPVRVLAERLTLR